MLDSYIKAILDNSPESIVLIGKNHEVLAYNKTISKVLKQYHGREVKVNDLYYPDFVIEANKKLYLDTFNRAIRGESVTVEDLTENENVSIWFEYRMTPVYDAQDILLGVTLSAKDITTRKKYEISLKESEIRFRKISNLAPIGILITDEKLGITYANNSARTIFDYEAGELTSLSLSDLINGLSFNENSGINTDSVSFETEKPVFYQEHFEGRSKNGRKVDILLSSSTFHSKEKLFYIFIIQDVTDAMMKENKISQQNDKLRDIAWSQAHIIRAPLANIMGIISLFEDKNVDMDQLERDTMNRALIQSAKDLDKVICEIIKKAE
ncbi:PAS domain S-box protein [Pedobacter sp. P351]|uniref:PAS domain S-box protein n=1 Tax=Pedobacter superstes TaxID=3133441 RepID=UPI0030A9EDE9